MLADMLYHNLCDDNAYDTVVAGLVRDTASLMDEFGA